MAPGTLDTKSQQWRSMLADHGLRVTSARVLVLDALKTMGHGTPEQLYEQMEPELPGLSVSTVYRTLESLAECEIVTHAHLDQASATYMLAAHADHAHLVCRECHEVTELDHDIATRFADQINSAHGFDIDTSHLGVFGCCAKCSGSRD